MLTHESKSQGACNFNCPFENEGLLKVLGTCLRGRVVNALSRHVQQSVTCSVAGVRLGPGAPAYQRIVSNNSYARDEQRVNPEQVRGFDGVLYKL